MTNTDKIPVTINGQQVGWSTTGLDVEFFEDDKIPEPARSVIKQMKEDSLKRISIEN
jgi:hypothetical protein